MWAPVQTKKNLAVLEVSPNLDIDLFPFKELFERLSRNTSTSRSASFISRRMGWYTGSQ